MRILTSQKASTLLEVAIIMPFFLMGLFFIIWMSYIVNTKNSLISAVENGVRLASTRGKPGLYQGVQIEPGVDSGAINPLDKYYLFDDVDALRRINTEGGNTEPYMHLLAYNTPENEFQDRYASYTDPMFKSVSTQYGAGDRFDLKDLPVYYMYAIAYANKAMRMSMGDSIRYPCKPDDETDLQKGENCLFCYPVNPITLDSTPFNPDPQIGAKGDWTLIMRKVAIRCDYKPGGFITRPMLTLLSFISGEGGSNEDKTVMSHFTYFDSYEECYFQKAAGGFSRYCCKDFSGMRSYCF